MFLGSQLQPMEAYSLKCCIELVCCVMCIYQYVSGNFCTEHTVMFGAQHLVCFPNAAANAVTV